MGLEKVVPNPYTDVFYVCVDQCIYVNGSPTIKYSVIFNHTHVIVWHCITKKEDIFE